MWRLGCALTVSAFSGGRNAKKVKKKKNVRKEEMNVAVNVKWLKRAHHSECNIVWSGGSLAIFHTYTDGVHNDPVRTGIAVVKHHLSTTCNQGCCNLVHFDRHIYGVIYRDSFFR